TTLCSASLLGTPTLNSLAVGALLSAFLERMFLATATTRDVSTLVRKVGAFTVVALCSAPILVTPRRCPFTLGAGYSTFLGRMLLGVTSATLRTVPRKMVAFTMLALRSATILVTPTFHSLARIARNGAVLEAMLGGFAATAGTVLASTWGPLVILLGGGTVTMLALGEQLRLRNRLRHFFNTNNNTHYR
ncbi:unnamed protein product, partial [marine sediment metagenome]